MNAATEIEVGRHRMARNGPNFATMTMRGAVSGQEARLILQTLAEWLPSDATCYLLCDAREMSSLAADGRKEFANWIQRRTAPEYVAYFGLSFAASTVIMLLTNASRLLGRTPNVKTFDTEPEARAWLASLGAQASA